MLKIVIPDDAPPVFHSSQACERIADAEVVINIRSSSKFTDSVSRRCPRLRLLSRWETGQRGALTGRRLSFMMEKRYAAMRKFLRNLSFPLLCAIVLHASDCTRTAAGFTPLNGPFFFNYHGFQGGLYPDRANLRPADHETAGLRLAAEVRPRDASGEIDDKNGRIVLISIGMSNTTQEFSTFKPMADGDPDKNSLLLLVDGAQGGWSSDRIVADPDTYWATVEQRLKAAGVTDAQVQVAWAKLAHAGPSLPFPDDAQQLQSEIETIVKSLPARFPNLKLLYLSSRIYAGYADTLLNPEPFAYQSGFSVKWLIEKQIEGDPSLSFDKGAAPWMSWGPYLWADGERPRTDGLVWYCSDLADDGTHPSPSGRMKVAKMLLDFFKGDETTRPWFVRSPEKFPPTPEVTAAVNAAGFFPVLAPGAIATLFGSEMASGEFIGNGLPLPAGLGGTRVVIGGEPAALYFVSPGQINLVVPPGARDHTITVFRETAQSKTFEAAIQLWAPGIFTLDGSGSGAASAFHADGRVVSTKDPALHGESIVIFSTGKGVRNPLILIVEPLPILRIGGVSAAVESYGPGGGPGVDRLEVIVPADSPVGPDVPVTLQLGAFLSNTVTLAVGK